MKINSTTDTTSVEKRFSSDHSALKVTRRVWAKRTNSKVRDTYATKWQPCAERTPEQATKALLHEGYGSAVGAEHGHLSSCNRHAERLNNRPEVRSQGRRWS